MAFTRYQSAKKQQAGLSSLLIVLILTLILELALFSVLLLSRVGIKRSLSNQYSQYAYYAVEGALNDTFHLFRTQQDWPPGDEITDQFTVGEATVRRKISYDPVEQQYDIKLDASYKNARRSIEAMYQKPQTVVSEETEKPLDVVFVVDSSGSMIDSIQGLKQALINTVNLPVFDENDRISLVTYAGNDLENENLITQSAILAVPLTPKKESIIEAVQAMNVGGLTNISSGLLLGAGQLDENSRADAKKVMIVFTDGVSNLGQTSQGKLICKGWENRTCYDTTNYRGFFPDGYGTPCTDNTIRLGQVIGKDKYEMFGVYYTYNFKGEVSNCTPIDQEVQLGRRTLQDTINNPENFYETDDPEELEKIFGRITDQIQVIKDESYTFREVEPENE